MPSPSRKRLKEAMLQSFLETDPEKKKELSREFTRLLFQFVQGKMKSKGEEEVSLMQMEAVGLFTQYVFRKSREKKESREKTAKQILKEIANESDELFDEIESRITHPA